MSKVNITPDRRDTSIRKVVYRQSQHLTNADIDILFGGSRLASLSISRLAQKPCTGVLTGQVVSDSTGPCKHTP